MTASTNFYGRYRSALLLSLLDLTAPAREVREMKFAIGDKVVKPLGYPYPGEVRSVFTTKAGATRYVVESEVLRSMLHIFNEDQLAKAPPARTTLAEIDRLIQMTNGYGYVKVHTDTLRQIRAALLDSK